MSSGPLTPPPSTETEIEDAARTVGSPAPADSASTAASAASLTPDAFTRLFPQIASFATEGDYSALIRTAEAHDSSSEDERQPTRFFLTAPLVLAYLINDDMCVPSTRALCPHTPPCCTPIRPFSNQLFGLVASVSERKHTNVYARAQKLVEFVGQADFLDQSLGAVLSNMLAAFLNAFRQRIFKLLQRAYMSLPLSLAEKYLGMSSDEVLSAAASGGWSYDSSTQILTPAVKTVSAAPAPVSTLSTFGFVSSSVAKLEM
ncbi:unnamed protein product [Mycena citricolor]|uniref:CSN8/PSMD8/EIF3K domain-containing protein n=1 Tax=Mycena citricolor TaxID=2018698 RepID=A0AAD2HMH7_9AGAR|nr:unnamed protein product [Mycena citricolor]